MALKPIAPGERRRNKHWIFRGYINGKLREITTKFPAGTPPRTIRMAVAEAEREIRNADAERRIPGPGEKVAFKRAVELYAAYRGLDLRGRHPDAKRLNRLIGEIGTSYVDELRHADLIAAANTLYPGLAAASRNREAMRPAAAVLHYAADSGYCPWLRIKLFAEPRPKPRAVTIETARTLFEAVPPGPKALFVLWSFKQGTRISDTLRICWSDIDLPRQVVSMRIGKTDSYVDFPLDPEVFEALTTTPQVERTGRLFPWAQKTGVYKWLRPLTRDLGIAWTPHMGRHSLGTWLNAERTTARTIQAALGHADPKSSARYSTPDLETIREAMADMPRLAKK